MHKHTVTEIGTGCYYCALSCSNQSSPFYGGYAALKQMHKNIFCEIACQEEIWKIKPQKTGNN